jgi:hypothetical protein
MKKKLLVFAALLVLALACASIALADKDVTEGAFVDWGELDEIAHVGGHDVRGEQWVEDEAPKCEVFGQYHIVCNVGDTTHIHYVYVKPLNHKYANGDSAWDSDSGNRDWGVIFKQPTCQEEGLAVDVCKLCGALNEEKTRVIQKADHVYNDETYVVVKEPSCGENGEGLGQHVCVNCGEPKANEPVAAMVVIPKIAHDWSDWREDEPSTCDEYGIAARTCIRCGATQFLDEQNPVRDHGVLVTIQEVLPLKNLGWAAAAAALNGQDFEDLSALEQVLAGLNFEYISENELTDCYTRTVTYTCPYCFGFSVAHDDITATYGVVEHEFLDVPDEESLAATCTKNGYNVYLCKYDNVHGHVNTALPDGYEARMADDKQIVEVTDELGHDFGEWMPFGEPYTKDGEEYQVYVSFCSRCDAHQQETKKLVKDGFWPDENGWRLWNEGVPSEESGFIYVKQEDNWFVLKGGYWDTDVTGFQNMFGREWMVENGELQKYNNGLVPFKGGIYAISEGMLWKEWNGIHWLGDEAYLLQFGQWFPDVNRVFFEGSNAILITNGKVDHEATSYTDPVSGKTYDVINGIIQGY